MPRLKLSAPDWCFYRSHYDPATYYTRLKSFGYTGVEMVDSSRLRHALAAGLAVVNVAGPGMKQGLNRRENHPKLLEEIRRSMSEARASGIPHVILFSGNREGLDDEEGLENCVHACRQLAGEAEAQGITLAFEMLNGFNHPDYQADRSRFGFRLARAVGSPRVKVLYDIYHMHLMGEDVVADILENLPWIAHLHVAGSRLRAFPDHTQDIAYPEIVAQVMAAGYTGYWGLEFVPIIDALEEAEKAAGLFHSFLTDAR